MSQALQLSAMGLHLARLIFIAFFCSHSVYAADNARIWASQCFQCHGTNGYPVGDADEIGGKDAKSLYEELIEMKYRNKTEGIMDLHARGYSDNQLRAIAKYLSMQDRVPNLINNDKSNLVHLFLLLLFDDE